MIRHSIALDPDKARSSGLSDGERPLTRPGNQRARGVACGLRLLLQDSPVNVILTSPLLRARQTAAIVADYLGNPPVDETESLVPTTTMEAIDTELHRHFGAQRVILVGHEPSLSRWLTWSLTRHHDRFASLQTGSAALLDFPGAPEGGTGALHWLLTPEQLDTLA